MRYELYIDNQHVDMAQEDIVLNYKSNILSPIDKILSNHSYTIKLRKTERNLKLVQCADMPSSQSSFAYTNHRATLYREGIEVVSNAIVVLLEISKEIQISLTWGNLSHLAPLIKGGKNLRDMDYGEVEGQDFVFWDEYKLKPPFAYYNIELMSEKVPYHRVHSKQPLVLSVNDILQRIARDLGIKIESNIPNDAVLPMLSFRMSPKEEEKSKCRFTGATLEKVNDAWRINLSKNISNEFAKASGTFSKHYDNTKLRLAIYCKCRNVGSSMTAISLGVYDGDKNVEDKLIERLEEASEVYDEQGIWHYYFENEIELDVTTRISFYLDTTMDMRLEEFELYSELMPGTIVQSRRENTEYHTYCKLYYNVNLPDMTQLDFIKSIIQIFCLIVVPTDVGIKLIPFGEVLRTGNVVDWTDKIVNKSDSAQKIEFRLSDLAQHNYMKFQKDQDVKGNYDYTLDINNETLPYERTLVSSAFGACDKFYDAKQWGDVYQIPLFDSKGVPKQSAAPRIMFVTDVNGQQKLVFKDWKQLVYDYYFDFEKFTEEPKVLTEEVFLSSADLKNLDLAVPVYLRQYGNYFAVLEIKTSKTDLCKVKLLKI